MEIQQQTQAAFNLAIPRLNSINNILERSVQGFLKDDINAILKSEKALFREISPKLKNEAIEEIKKEFNNLAPYLIAHNKNFNLIQDSTSFLCDIQKKKQRDEAFIKVRKIKRMLLVKLEKIDELLRRHLEKLNILIPNKANRVLFEDMD